MVLALPGLALAIYDGGRHHWRRMDLTVLAGILAVVVLVLLPKWVSSPAFAIFQGNIGDHFYYLGVAFMAMRHDISALEIAKVGLLVTSGPEIAAPFQLITGRPAAALMFGGIAAILRQPALLASYAYLGALQVCVFFAAALITRNLFKLPSLLTLWVAIGLAVGFFVQYTFDINAWSQLASISLTITIVGLFVFALVGARSSSDAPKTCALSAGGFFLSMLAASSAFWSYIPRHYRWFWQSFRQ